MEMESRFERRKFLRLFCHKDAMAEIKPFSIVVGQVVDISCGGISFRYIDTGNIISDTFELNLWDGSNIYMKNLLVEKKSDIGILCSDRLKTTALRRCGVKFCEMNARQQSAINNFSKSAIINSAESMLDFGCRASYN